MARMGFPRGRVRQGINVSPWPSRCQVYVGKYNALIRLERTNMGHNLAGKRVDDIVVEILGPVTGRNHFPALGAAAPSMQVQMFGADPVTTIQVETCTTLEIRGTNNSNAIGSVPVRGGKLLFSRDAADWSPLGAPLLVASGLVVLAPPAGTTDAPIAIRARVTVVPAAAGQESVGSFVMGTLWS